jgi:aryl-alcohol dehydrogenase-like predicted oxidoreductase
MRKRITTRTRETAGKVGDMAKERGLTSAQFALLWLKDQPGVTAPIIGPRTLEHLEELIPVMDMELDDNERTLFDELVHPGNAVTDFHSTTHWIKARILD